MHSQELAMNKRRWSRSLLYFGLILLLLLATTERMMKVGPLPSTATMKTVAHKETSMNVTATSLTMFSKKRTRVHPGPICMLHVGKTAGSLLACAFGFPLPTCNTTQQQTTRNIPDLQRLSRRVRMGGHSHVGTYSCNPQAAAYLTPVRNPIERIRSWFYFEQSGVGGLHTSDCYQNSFERMVEDLESAIDSKFPFAVENMTCAQTAWAALMGARRIGSNSFYNFEYYYGESQRQSLRGISKEQPMLVVRTEHIEDDLNGINRLIGGKGTPGTVLAAHSANAGIHYRSQQQSNASSAVSSLAGLDLTFLCRALCRDIQYYKRFLLRSSNLKRPQIQDSIEHLREYCPEETESLREDCANHVPRIPTAVSERI